MNKKLDSLVIETVPANSNKRFYLMDRINRAIKPGQVSKLVRSIVAMGVIRPVIIANIDFIDNVKRSYIIDGQHLFTALLRLNLPIPYKTIEVKNKEELVEKIAMLNSSSLSWVFADYVKAWASLDDKEDYRKLLNYKQKYDQTYEVLSMVFSMSDRTVASKRIKNGSFKILNEKKGLEILNSLNDILPLLVESDRTSIRNFVGKYAKFRYMSSLYNHNKFIGYVKKNRNLANALSASEEESEKFFEKFKN
jgi:hypothetical protein